MGTIPSTERSVHARSPRSEPVSLPDGPPGLPVPLTALVGRERELALAGALINRADVRLLTLTGPGGIGKNRLALRLATDMADAFAER
jgi:hypothetical protein